MSIQFLFLTCLCLTFSLIVLAEINGYRNDADEIDESVNEKNY